MIDIRDLEGCGHYVVNVDDAFNTSFLASRMRKVPYHKGEGMDYVDKLDGNAYMLVDMIDGLTRTGVYIKKDNISIFQPWLSKQDLVDYLNENNYRIATQEEVIRVILYQRSKYQL